MRDRYEIAPADFTDMLNELKVDLKRALD